MEKHNNFTDVNDKKLSAFVLTTTRLQDTLQLVLQSMAAHMQMVTINFHACAATINYIPALLGM